ncbi:MAG: DUF2332 domain-containing protein [Devosiaceae bacterium]|nr:DUF2332 domain-containing protein [Devosiaceae bacterium]
MDKEAIIRQSFALQAKFCADLGSPFTANLLEGLGKNLNRLTKTGRTILDWDGQPDAFGDAIALRLAGALHGLVRSGQLPKLAKFYPPHSFTSPKELAKATMIAISEADDEICHWLTYAPQTNEVARSALLYLGMRVIAKETGLPLSIYELGSSAGLNLMLDKFHYRFAGQEFGALGSKVVLAPKWIGKLPDGANPHIINRRGCDLNPLDIENPAHRLRLLAYIWPDQQERLDRAKAAIEIALNEPPKIDKADAADWVENVIDKNGEKGVARILFHSITYQYFPEDIKARIVTHMEELGNMASKQTPLAWLAFEQFEDQGACLTLRLWQGSSNDGDLILLAKAGAHVKEINWL